MHHRLFQTLERVQPIDRDWIEQARLRQLQLTKPPGSLGRLEEVANRIAAMQRTLAPAVDRSRIVIFAADHGVCAEGVNPYPQAVTAQMLANFANGGAAINALARVSGSDLRVVDVGVASDAPAVPGVISRKVAHGTNNFCCEAAMSREQAEAALWAGMEMAQQASLEGCALIGIGEMGIGNTTAASAMTAVLTGMPVASVVGRGTGADDACLIRKISAVERALALHEPGIRDAFDILERLGGFEIGAMAGACLGAAAHGRVVVVDGFIATVAAAWAVRLRPEVADYLFVSHRSTEPGHALLLDAIRQRPLLDLEMRLGEGTGAALAIPMIRAAVEAFTCMATFADAGVSDGAEAR